MSDAKTDPIRFVRYAWFVVAYMIGIILWGAWVRITHSGAGCGDHWPTCNGEVVPFAPSTETLIEYTHRLTSGLSLPLVIVLMVWAFRLFPRGHRVRKASVGTLFFLLTEAAVGAGLVKFELVADNDSVARAITASFHLVNTFILTAFSALTAWWANGVEAPKWSQRHKRTVWIAVLLVALMATSMTGAITALGDTLFPKDKGLLDGSLMSDITDDLSGTEHFLVRLRVVHPIIAVATALFAVIYTSMLRIDGVSGRTRTWSHAVTMMIIVQTVVGLINVVLKAPGWVQLMHLFVAVCLWVSAVFLFYAALARPEELAGDQAGEPGTDPGNQDASVASAS